MPSVTVSDRLRQAVACYYGTHRAKASRADMRRYLRAVGWSIDDDVLYEYDQCSICNPKPVPD